MSIAGLKLLVTNAIRRAEELEDSHDPGMVRAYLDVSVIEDRLASNYAPDSIDGRVARRGAIRAALSAGFLEWAHQLADRYLAEPDVPEDLAVDMIRLVEEDHPTPPSIEGLNDDLVDRLNWEREYIERRLVVIKAELDSASNRSADDTPQVLVRLPTQLRRLTDGVAEITVRGHTVSDLLADLSRRYPELEKFLGVRDATDRGGGYPRFLTLFLGDDDIRFLDGLSTAVTDGQRLTALPTVSGGCMSVTSHRPSGAETSFQP